MIKKLRVIEPFFTASVGDVFELSEDGSQYVTKQNEEFHGTGENSDIKSTYTATFSISPSYAKELIDNDYLEEMTTAQKKDTPFKNVFDEIDNLIKKYDDDLANMNKDEQLKQMPECMRVERTTVLTNILTVLNYLKTLRK